MLLSVAYGVRFRVVLHVFVCLLCEGVFVVFCLCLLVVQTCCCVVFVFGRVCFCVLLCVVCCFLFGVFMIVCACLLSCFGCIKTCSACCVCVFFVCGWKSCLCFSLFTA